MSMLKHWGQDAPPSLSDVLQVELDMRWSREGGIMAPLTAETGDVPLGAVLARDAEGRFVPYLVTDAAPANAAVAVLISRLVPVSEAEQPCTVVARGVTVAAQNLCWLPAVTDEQKKIALSQMKTLGIVPTE